MTASALRAPQADRPDAGAQGAAPARPLIVSGALAAVAAAGVGLAVLVTLAVIGWVAAPHPKIGLVGAVRTAAVLWLVGHHVTVQISGAGRIGMLPLGLVLLPAALLRRAGRSLVRGRPVTGVRQVLGAAAAIAVPYAILAGLLALASRSGLAAASVPQAVLAGFAVAFAAAGFGAARGLAPWAQLGTLMSARTRSVLAGTAGALAVLTVAGAMATALSLAHDIGRFGAVYRLLEPGVVGSALLFLAQLAYLPNAILWAMAYMLGPGFAVGAGTVVAPTGSVTGPLPAFPLLAALPAGHAGAGTGALAALLLALPYLAGAIGGLLVARQGRTTALESAPLRGFCCGLLTGLVLGLLAAFAGGPLGDGRLAAVGPSAWQVAVVAWLEVGIAAAITAGAANWWQVRSRLARAGAGRAAGAGPAVPPKTSASDDRRADRDGHVIYLDRWAADHDVARHGPSGGPSDLP